MNRTTMNRSIFVISNPIDFILTYPDSLRNSFRSKPFHLNTQSMIFFRIKLKNLILSGVYPAKANKPIKKRGKVSRIAMSGSAVSQLLIIKGINQ